MKKTTEAHAVIDVFYRHILGQTTRFVVRVGPMELE